MRLRPRWVPAAVFAVNARVVDAFARDLRYRLLNDQRMERIWKRLAREGHRRARELEAQRPRLEGRYAFLPQDYRMETWGLDPPRPTVKEPEEREASESKVPEEQEERAAKALELGRAAEADAFAEGLCAAFYLAVLHAFAIIPEKIVRASELEHEAQRRREAAKLCRQELCSPNWPSPIDPAVAKALKIAEVPKIAEDLKDVEALKRAAAYFERRADSIDAVRRNNIYIVDRASLLRAPGSSNGIPGDDRLRGPTRALALATQEIFGRPMREVVAGVVTVASGMPVSAKAVENWGPSPTKQGP